jgi:hypothetical protein
VLNTVATTATAGFLAAHSRTEALIHGYAVAAAWAAAMLFAGAVFAAVLITARPKTERLRTERPKTERPTKGAVHE